MSTWIGSLELKGGRLAARSACGELLELNDLARLGLPSERTSRMGSVSVQLDAMHRVSSEDYRDALGISMPEQHYCRHDVFEATVDGATLVIPALALVRAIFRPLQDKLGGVFAPQLADFLATFENAQETPKISEGPALQAVRRSWRHSNALQTAAWLVCHPSARAMVGSIHARALSGHLSLALPHCEARAAVHGKKQGGKFYVTAITLTSVTPGDEPTLRCDLTSNRYILRGTPLDAEPDRSARSKSVVNVPLHRDGSVELTDAEWREVKPLLHSSKAVRTRFCQRAIADGVLTKLSTGVPWNRVTYREGGATNASFAWHSWKRGGRMDAVLDVLRTHRLRPE